MPYAAKTRIDPMTTQFDIQRLLKKYGADRFAYFTEPSNAVIVFEAQDRRLKFSLPLPDGSKANHEQKTRGLWRSLLLCIKAKLEGVAVGIETFEEAFLAHVVMPDGKTVGEHVLPTVSHAYKTGLMSSQPMLPPPSNK